MEIPYTVAVRRDTGLTNGKIGIWLFLASEVMLFGALFASYILIRTGAHTWPRGDTILNVPLATFNTIVLISSSVTMVMAWASLVRNQFQILPAEGVALARGEIRERHPVAAAHAGIHFVNLGRESVWREPLDHGVRIEERAVHALGRGPEDPVKADGIGHGRFSFG